MIQLVVCVHSASTLKALNNYEKEEKSLTKSRESRVMYFPPAYEKSPSGQTKKHAFRSKRGSPHNGTTVTSFVGAGVAATRRRRGVARVDVTGTQWIPAPNGHKVLLPWGWRAAAGLVG